MGVDDGAVARVLTRWNDLHTVLAVCIGSYFAVRFVQVVVGSVVPMLVETFAVSRGRIGVALTGMWVTYALSQLPSGVLGDRFGERAAILVAMTITASATLGLSVAPTFSVFALGTFLLGVGAGLYYNPATALLTREFEGIGRAIGSHRVGGQVAGVVAPVVAATASVRYGWRAAIAVGSLLVVAATVFVRSSVPAVATRSTTSLRERADTGTLVDLLSRPHTRRTTVMMTLVEFVGLAAMAFLPIFLIEHHGFSVLHANALFGVFFAISALCQPLGGWLSDRIGRDGTVAVLASAGVLGYGLLAVGDVRLLVVPAVALAGTAMGTTPVLQSRMMDGLSATNRGTGFGLFRTLYLLVGALGTTVVGTTADAAGWGPAFGLPAALFVVVLLSAISASEPGSSA